MSVQSLPTTANISDLTSAALRTSPHNAAKPAKASQQPQESPKDDQASSKDQAIGPEKLAELIHKANNASVILRSNLQFTSDPATGIDVVKVVDTQTKEVIRQIPSEEMLAIARHLDELKGLLIRDTA